MISNEVRMIYIHAQLRLYHARLRYYHAHFNVIHLVQYSDLSRNFNYKVKFGYFVIFT